MFYRDALRATILNRLDNTDPGSHLAALSNLCAQNNEVLEMLRERT